MIGPVTNDAAGTTTIERLARGPLERPTPWKYYDPTMTD